MNCSKCGHALKKIKTIYIPKERTAADYGLPTRYEDITFFQCPHCKWVEIQ